MARDLELMTNVDAPSSDYPSGRIRNDTGTGNGTPLSEETKGDVFQFFAKLLRDAGITPNNLPENETNGYQLNQAIPIVANTLGYTSTGVVVNTVDHTEAQTVEYKKDGNLVTLKGVVTVGDASATLLFTLPVGARPALAKGFGRPAIDPNLIADPANDCIIYVQADGQVLFYYTGITPLNKNICVDGVQFWV